MKRDKRKYGAAKIIPFSPEELREYLWTMNLIKPIAEISTDKEFRLNPEWNLFPFMGWVLGGGGLPWEFPSAFSYLKIDPRSEPVPFVIRDSKIHEAYAAWAKELYPNPTHRTATYYLTEPKDWNK